MDRPFDMRIVLSSHKRQGEFRQPFREVWTLKGCFFIGMIFTFSRRQSSDPKGNSFYFGQCLNLYTLRWEPWIDCKLHSQEFTMNIVM
jgi:hypothetical protein